MLHTNVKIVNADVMQPGREHNSNGHNSRKNDDRYARNFV